MSFNNTHTINTQLVYTYIRLIQVFFNNFPLDGQYRAGQVVFNIPACPARYIFFTSMNFPLLQGNRPLASPSLIVAVPEKANPLKLGDGRCQLFANLRRGIITA